MAKSKFTVPTHSGTPRRPTPLYACWLGIRRRCFHPKTKGYCDYGGRGITVCERWLASFENFVQDMGPKPSPKHSIERDDVNGNYTPENCRWATKPEQESNKRNSRLLTYQGQTNTLSEWARISGVPFATLHWRAARLNGAQPDAPFFERRKRGQQEWRAKAESA